MMQSENLTFTAETEAPDAMSDLANLPFGSTIEVSGVCFTESGEDGKAKIVSNSHAHRQERPRPGSAQLADPATAPDRVGHSAGRFHRGGGLDGHGLEKERDA
jgi:hypothetical protein